MLDNALGNGLLLAGTVALAVVVVSPGLHEGAEALIARMLGDVDSSTAENIVILHHNWRPQ